MRILVNHRGYDLQTGLRAVFQNPEEVCLRDVFLVEALSGRKTQHFSPEPLTAVPGWKNRWYQTIAGDLCVRPGRYRLQGKTSAGKVCSENFTIRERQYREKDLSDILSYFKSMRSAGDFDEADRNAPVWGREGETRDVHGGWYDASGDTSKYLSHLSYAGRMSPQQTPLVVWTLADALLRYDEAGHWEGSYFRRWVCHEIIHGADFLLRMQDREGWFYKTLFDVWSKDGHQRILSSFRTQKGERLESVAAGFREGGGMACAALAAASRIAGDDRKDAFLSAAVRGYGYLKEHSEELLEGGPGNLIDLYCALMAACELYDVTGEEAWRDEVRRVQSELNRFFHSRGNGQGWWLVDRKEQIPFYHASDEGLVILACLKGAAVLGGDPAAAETREHLKQAFRFLDETLTAEPDPFGYPRHWVQNLEQPELQWFYPHENPSGYWWQGENSRISSLGSAVLALGEAFPELAGKARSLALHQADWQLGLNPFGVSMVDGWGYDNPDYEADYYNLPGGVCNGITSGFGDESDIAFQPDLPGPTGDNSWRWGEQWIPHAAWFYYLIALIRLSY